MTPPRASRLLPPLAAVLIVLFAGTAQAVPAASCTSAQRAGRVAALKAFESALPRARAAYFRRHSSPAARKAFVRAQKAKLAALKSAAACVVPGPPIAPLPPPEPAPAPTANEHFFYSDGVSADARSTIEGDVAYAVADEQKLLGVQLDDVNVYASVDPAWLAQAECGFFGWTGDCVAQKTAEYETGADEGGYHSFFLSGAHDGFRSSASETQKTIAHELFHTLQYQLVNMVTDPVPNSGIRHLGPVWIVEGTAELLGYRVLGDRHLGYSTYPNLLLTEKGRAKLLRTPLDQLLTVDQDRAAGNPYVLYMVAADHLVSLVPAGLPSLVTYFRAIAAGQAWPDAFQTAFGMTVDEFYANFAAYRAGL